MAALYFYEFFGSQGGTWQGGDDTIVAPDINAPDTNMVFGDVTQTLEGIWAQRSVEPRARIR